MEALEQLITETLVKMRDQGLLGVIEKFHSNPAAELKARIILLNFAQDVSELPVGSVPAPAALSPEEVADKADADFQRDKLAALHAMDASKNRVKVAAPAVELDTPVADSTEDSPAEVPPQAPELETPAEGVS